MEMPSIDNKERLQPWVDQINKECTNPDDGIWEGDRYEMQLWDRKHCRKYPTLRQTRHWYYVYCNNCQKNIKLFLAFNEDRLTNPVYKKDWVDIYHRDCENLCIHPYPCGCDPCPSVDEWDLNQMGDDPKKFEEYFNDDELCDACKDGLRKYCNVIGVHLGLGSPDSNAIAIDQLTKRIDELCSVVAELAHKVDAFSSVVK